MLLKRIEAGTMTEALAKVRKECGDDALLVETKQVGGRCIVVAARQERPAKPSVATVAANPSNAPTRRWTRGFREIAARGEAFGLSQPLLTAVENALVGTRVHLDAPGDPAVPTTSARVLKALIRTTPWTLPDWRVTAFVGPTGVGKTTTLAKLAARARSNDESVALVTVDTYRVAAVEQLRAFADMLAIPLEVCFTPADLRRALETHRGADRILVDTSGRSPFDARSIEQMRGMLSGVAPRIALCLPAGLRRADAAAATEAFESLAPDCVILTKWDETRAPGETLSFVVERDLPISHVTIGQEVPADILVADPGALAAAALSLEDSLAEAVL